jgi:hypothetical protein
MYCSATRHCRHSRPDNGPNGAGQRCPASRCARQHVLLIGRRFSDLRCRHTAGRVAGACTTGNVHRSVMNWRSRVVTSAARVQLCNAPAPQLQASSAASLHASLVHATSSRTTAGTIAKPQRHEIGASPTPPADFAFESALTIAPASFNRCTHLNTHRTRPGCTDWYFKHAVDLFQ